MEKKLSNNLGLKILSVFLAFFVWLAVVNISNPEKPGSQEVTLEILNDDVLEASGKTYELMGDRSTVTISYKVRTLDSANIKPTDFRAYIDLADMYEPTGAVPVKVEVKNNKVQSVVAKPSVIRVDTEDLQRKPFDLEVKVEGEPESGYDIGIPTISPTYVYVSGPVSVVGRISTVGIRIKAEGANSDLSGTEQVRCFDANDNELTQLDDRVTFSRSEIDYTLPILKKKNLTLIFETEGKVAEGYRYTGIESSSNSVEVNGLKSDLAGANSVTIPKTELNMDGATGDKEVTLDLNKYLPEGVTLADPDSNEIKVVIKVEALENRTYELPVSQIQQVGASGQYEYEYDRDSVNVIIRGLKEDLDQLTPADIQAEMDVSGMEPGIHTGVVSFVLGDAYELMSSNNIQVTVTEKGPSGTGETTQGESQPETEDEDSPKETTGA